MLPRIICPTIAVALDGRMRWWLSAPVVGGRGKNAGMRFRLFCGPLLRNVSHEPPAPMFWCYKLYLGRMVFLGRKMLNWAPGWCVSSAVTIKLNPLKNRSIVRFLSQFSLFNVIKKLYNSPTNSDLQYRYSICTWSWCLPAVQICTAGPFQPNGMQCAFSILIDNCATYTSKI